jgi:hypothetical protein
MARQASKHIVDVAETFKVVKSMHELSQADWDALADGDADATPFTAWAWLEALEHSGCASPRAGWTPQHLTLWRGARLVAAAPCYAKADSDGDFSRDWHLADAVMRGGHRYYPKLQITVPFTPATGRRFLVARDVDRAAAVRTLVDGAREHAREHRMGGVHVLFPTESETAALAGLGLARRQSIQFHWHNRGFETYDDFLAVALDSKRRHQARRERAAAASQGITIRTVRGADVAVDPDAWADTVHGFYRSTIDKLMWGRPWLNHAFYKRIFRAMPHALEVVEARRDGRFVAGAFNVASSRRLYGRYWGCHEEHPFLHFHVCLYHSIDDCIRRGLEAFEGGAGGEHKMSRGFDPTETHSLMELTDPALDRVVRQHLRLETEARQREMASWRAQNPRAWSPES